MRSAMAATLRERPTLRGRQGGYSRPVHHHLIITIGWALAIAEFAAAQRAAGSSPSSVRSRIQHLQQFARAVPVEPWEVSTEDILIWAGRMSWAPETRRGRYNTFRLFWGWGKATKRCRKDAGKHLPKVRPGVANPRPVPERIYQGALTRAAPRESLWMELAHDHGLRRGEVAEIHSDDIFADLVGHSLIVRGKGGKDRTIPLTPRCARQLLELEPGWAFPSDEQSTLGHVTPRWIGHRISDLLGAGWTMHKLRHSAGTAFYIHGDLAIAQRLLGHSSPATTMIYVKLPDERLRATILAAAS